jgi:hypothetical protein
VLVWTLAGGFAVGGETPIHRPVQFLRPFHREPPRPPLDFLNMHSTRLLFHTTFLRCSTGSET